MCCNVIGSIFDPLTTRQLLYPPGSNWRNQMFAVVVDSAKAPLTEQKAKWRMV
jgi:hypothetical protein